MSSQLLEAHKSKLENYSAKLLDAYVVRRQQESQPIRAKEFNDPIWGTLRIRAVEVVVVDSPLLQRLRRIRQLGVAHLVYPAAVHTRLEHSIGVTHQVQRLVESINEHAMGEDDERPRIQDAHLALLRLAALCHDIGHGFMSHVVENALENNRECDDIRLAFQRSANRTRKNQLSEIAAYYMIGSPAFRSLLREADRLAPKDLPLLNAGLTRDQNLDRFQDLMQKIIVSDQIDPSYPLLQELISGPFDADKLDYMPRDAQMCGVPVVTDVARLVQKVRAVKRPAAVAPEEVKKRGPGRDAYIITGVARSGARTLDELALGRALLFDKIYRHQKVRAAETMVSSIVSEILAACPDDPAMLPFKFADEEILGLTEASAVAALELREADEVQRERLANVVDMANRLRDRRLLARGFAFSSKMPLDPYRNDPTQHSGVERLNREASDPRRRSEMVERLLAEAETISEILHLPRPSTVVPGRNGMPYIWIAPPVVSDDTGDATQIGHAYLIDEVGTDDRRADKDYAETRGWSDAYIATRDLGLIFCPTELTESIYLSAEVLVREEFGVRIPHSMMQAAKVNRGRIDDLRQMLTEAGYYEGKSLDLTSPPLVLTRGDTDDRVGRVVKKLAGYQGPLRFDVATGKSLDPELSRERVKDWLRQFREDSLAEAALIALEALHFIDRPATNAVVEEVLERRPELHGASITPLGGANESSSVLTYLAGDAANRFQCVPRSLDSALANSNRVIMVDDFIGRGSGAITVFEGWLGEPDSQDLHQERPSALTTQMKELLRNADITLVSATGFEGGAQAIESRCRELGLQVKVELGSSALPNIFELDLPDPERFFDFCRARATEVFEEQGRADQWIANRTLGYGNRGLLVVSAYNTPTATLTCLWNGSVRPQGWQALLPRRAKR